MDIVEMFDCLVAVKEILSIGFFPNENNFKELTPSEYEKYSQQFEDEHIDGKLFFLTKSDGIPVYEMQGEKPMLHVLYEKDKIKFRMAEHLIRKIASESNKEFETDEQIITEATKMLSFIL